MTPQQPDYRASLARWIRACLILFFVMGLGFGSWLSRLPSLRDELGASMLQMSIYGLCLAVGSLLGMLISGGLIERFGPRGMMLVMLSTQVIALPGAVALMVTGFIPLGLIVLFVYGFAFSSTDIAMNVSGANADRLLGLPRLPLMHAAYSIGTVLAMGLGALAEVFRVPLLPHFFVIAVIVGLLGLFALRSVPRNELAFRLNAGAPVLDTSTIVPVIETSAGDGDMLTTHTGSIAIVPSTGANRSADAPKPPKTRRYSPWRDRRVLLLGLITLVAGLLDGAASDWLPLALVDGRGVSNSFGTVMLGVFFGAVVVSRLLGTPILVRFGRVRVLRFCLGLAAAGVLIVTLVPGTPAIVVGTIAWGLGAGIGWPITISAAADNPKTAIRDVAAVSAIGYASMLLGPMAFGFIGEYVGLLRAFWVLPVLVIVAILVASATRQPDEGRSS